jgi:hypothetical protein
MSARCREKAKNITLKINNNAQAKTKKIVQYFSIVAQTEAKAPLQ